MGQARQVQSPCWKCLQGLLVCLSAGLSFPLYSLDEVITKAQVQLDVREQLQEAMRVHKSGKAPFTRGSVTSTCVQGYRLINTYRFMPAETFQTTFGMSLDSVGLKAEELVDQFGKVVAGVTILDETELPKLEVYQRRWHWHLLADA